MYIYDAEYNEPSIIVDDVPVEPTAPVFVFVNVNVNLNANINANANVNANVRV